MKAMVLHQIAPIETAPLKLEEVPIPESQVDEILVKVGACGVCRTDLHVIEGDLKREKLPIIPGHQVVGKVVKEGNKFKKGDRIGIAWLRHTCQSCFYCEHGKENLCESSRYTGYHRDGGYAEYAVVPEEYAYHIPEGFSDAEATPLLCGGIVGYRAYKRADVPLGGKLGIYGFGSSAHIIFQIAKYQGCEVFVATRDPRHQAFAKEMGADWVGAGDSILPTPVDSIIIFAPAGNLVPIALRSLKPGGIVVNAGIHMSNIPQMSYEDCLFHEKQLRSVESNTRIDGQEFLALAEEIPIKPHITLFPLEKANEALLKVKQNAIQGTAVLIP
jgi:propanol-preferring alcohol dehydrogenase